MAAVATPSTSATSKQVIVSPDMTQLYQNAYEDIQKDYDLIVKQSELASNETAALYWVFRKNITLYTKFPYHLDRITDKLPQYRFIQDVIVRYTQATEIAFNYLKKIQSVIDFLKTSGGSARVEDLTHKYEPLFCVHTIQMTPLLTRLKAEGTTLQNILCPPTRASWLPSLSAALWPSNPSGSQTASNEPGAASDKPPSSDSISSNDNLERSTVIHEVADGSSPSPSILENPKETHPKKHQPPSKGSQPTKTHGSNKQGS